MREVPVERERVARAAGERDRRGERGRDAAVDVVGAGVGTRGRARDEVHASRSTVVPSCLAPLEVVAAGSPISKRPVVAVWVNSSRPFVSNFVEDRRRRRAAPQYWACLPITLYGQSAVSASSSAASRLRVVSRRYLPGG